MPKPLIPILIALPLSSLLLAYLMRARSLMLRLHPPRCPLCEHSHGIARACRCGCLF